MWGEVTCILNPNCFFLTSMLWVNYASCKFSKPCKKISLAIWSVRFWFWERSCLQTFCSMGTGNPSSFPMAMAQPFGWGPRSWGARWHLTTVSNLSWVCLSLNVMIQPYGLYFCFLSLFCKWHNFTRISSILLCFCLFFTHSTILLASQKSSKLLNIKALSEQGKSLAFSFC